MRLIDADSLKEFFNIPESGIDEVLSDLIYKHLDKSELLMDEFMAYDMLIEFIAMIENIIDTEPTIGGNLSEIN